METQHVIKLMEQLDYISPRASQKLLTLTKLRPPRIAVAEFRLAANNGRAELVTITAVAKLAAAAAKSRPETRDTAATLAIGAGSLAGRELNCRGGRLSYRSG